jgi:hypothetical protein
VYLYESSTDSFILISGTMKPYGTNGYEYDVDANVQSLLRESMQTNDTATSQGVIHGEIMQIATSRVDASFQVNAEYEQKALPDYYPYVFIVRGTSLSQWTPFEQSQLGILIFTLVFEFFVLLIMAVLVYRPISMFIRFLDDENSPKKPKQFRQRANSAAGSRTKGSEASSEQLSSALPIPRVDRPSQAQ